MKVTAKIKLDLRSQNYGSSVYAVQGDGGSRCVEAALLDGGKPWNVPAGVTAAVAYKKPDFTKGLYDKLADDTPAVTVSGSTVTVVLAKQMLTVPGSVQACIVFNNAALDQLTTFPFTVAVAANPVIGAEPSDDYIRLQWLEDKLDEYVKKITEGIVPGGSGGAVSSVNGKTGAVVLTADDVHALPDNTVIPTVPEKVSAFENDAGYLTEHQDISGKVDKVAGKGLSTHDYDNAAKAKVDAIPEDPKYTDTEYDDTAVVESLNQLKNDLDDLVNLKSGKFNVITTTEFVQGGWQSFTNFDGATIDDSLQKISGQSDFVSTTRIHIELKNTSEYQYVYAIFDKNKICVDYIGDWTTDSFDYSGNIEYIRYVISRKDNNIITPSDISSVKLEAIIDISIKNDLISRNVFGNLYYSMTKMLKGTCSYAILGDSITDTWSGDNHSSGGASDAEHGYPQILYSQLKNTFGDGIQFKNWGKGGDSLLQAYNRIDSEIIPNNYDLVIVELGTNDWNNQESLSNFESQYYTLISKLKTDTKADIILISLGYFDNWHSERPIKESDYNRVIKTIAEQKSIPYIDMYEAMTYFMKVHNVSFEDITFTDDPVHPNDLGHRIWADKAFALFYKMLIDYRYQIAN